MHGVDCSRREGSRGSSAKKDCSAYFPRSVLGWMDGYIKNESRARRTRVSEHRLEQRQPSQGQHDRHGTQRRSVGDHIQPTIGGNMKQSTPPILHLEELGERKRRQKVEGRARTEAMESKQTRV